jgi:microcystin-dependent protein
MTQVDSFIGEISLFPFTFIPDGWVECNGQPLNCGTYSKLYSVIGDKFGANPAANTFNVPKLNHRAVMGPGQGPGLTPRTDGATVGEELIALTDLQTGHAHALINKGAANPVTGKTSAPLPSSTIGAITLLPGPVGKNTTIVGGAPNAKMNTGSIGRAGAHLPVPHENRQPFLALRYCICFDGEYPSRG